MFPPAHRVLQAFYACGFLLSAVELLAGVHSIAQLVAVGVTLLVTVGVGIAGSRTPRWALVAGTLLGVVLIAGTIVGDQGSTGGEVLYVWPTLYAGIFLSRRTVAGYMVWLAAAEAVVLVLDGRAAGAAIRWIDVVGTMAVVVVVITALRRRIDGLVAGLAADAHIDALTGVARRSAFEQAFRAQLGRSRRRAESLAVLMLDVDHFKAINDEHGHARGDEVLAALGGVLLGEIRAGDLAGRMGGDEFAVVLCGADAAGADAFTTRVRAALRDAGALRDLPLGVSFGAVSGPPGEHSAHDLLHAADLALYRAKRTGRDRLVLGDVVADAA